MRRDAARREGYLREARGRPSRASSTISRLEVSPEMGKSYPGALTEGTQHRGGKGADQSTGRPGAAYDRGLVHRPTMRVSVSSRRVRRTIPSKRGTIPDFQRKPVVSFLLSEQLRTPARGRLVEAIDGYPFRTRVKRRKASTMGEVAGSTKDPISVGIVGVLATGWIQSLLILPREICWVPQFAVGRRT